MTKRIPVLHITKSLGLGGTEKAMQTMVTGLSAPNGRYAPAVWSLKDGERGDILRSLGIPVLIGQDIRLATAMYRPALIHVHRAGWAEPDFMRPIHAIRHHSPGPNPTSLRPVVVETNVFGRFDESTSGAAIDCTLFVSCFCAERYATLHHIKTIPPRYEILYNPVDTDFLASAVASPEKRDYSRPVIGRLSRPDPGKWSHLAYEFLPTLKAAIPDFRYRIIGGITEAQEFVNHHGLEQNVRFLEPITTEQGLAMFLETLSVFAHANDTGESFGLSIAEAMACGLPVVTHPCHGLKDNAQLELVEHEITGLIASTTEEYAHAIIHLLSNPDRARTLGKAGQQKAHRLYRSQVVCAQLERIYDRLLGVAHA